MFLLRPDSATSSLRFFLTCSKFDYVLHVHEDLTTLLLVSTMLVLRPTSSYCIQHYFQGGSKNVSECEGGINCSNHNSLINMHL